ncbi:hypothetical protein H5410_055150 [Solanum commersonii]|uniref:Uncharacterized protein n=1 Tax=Solanum commersonii TaxID=4109 RepID=A0A9J5WJ40_SOLCO|nr:hypothetical protein H5410_055150 [Solanum commersonii]
MAYAALSSLMYTLEQLFKPNQSFVCQSCTQQHVESLHQNLSALQDFLDDTTKDIETLKNASLNYYVSSPNPTIIHEASIRVTMTSTVRHANPKKKKIKAINK